MTRTSAKMTGVISLMLFLLFSVPAFSEEPTAAEEVPGTIKGKIVREDGSGFTPGFVAFFDSENLEPMDFGQTRRSPTMISFMDDKGEFTTNLMAPGSYFIGAMERKNWRGGPPQMGEKRYSAFDKKGDYVIVTLKDGQDLDIGVITVKEPAATPELTDFFTIKGRLTDKEGRGVLDAVVVVKRDYNDPKGEFISVKSDLKGRYQIKLPPGRYFLIARETVAGSMRPRAGSIYGELGQAEPIGIGGKNSRPPTFIVGESGQEYKNVDISMFEVPIPEVKRKETEALVKREKYSKDDLAENLPLRSRKTGNAVKSGLQAEGEGDTPKLNAQ